MRGETAGAELPQLADVGRKLKAAFFSARSSLRRDILTAVVQECESLRRARQLAEQHAG